MKRTSLSIAATAAALWFGIATMPAAQAADVEVSISISQPGVYGRVDIGRFPQPRVILPQPVISVHIDAFIPDDYVEDGNQRLRLYQRLASVKNVGEALEAVSIQLEKS